MSVEELVRFEIVHVSDCCGAYLNDLEAEYEVCPECREHCEVISEEVAVQSVAWCGE